MNRSREKEKARRSSLFKFESMGRKEISNSAGEVWFGGLCFALLLHFQYPFIVALLHFQEKENIRLIHCSCYYRDIGGIAFVRAAIGAYTVIMSYTIGWHVSCWVGGLIGWCMNVRVDT